MATMHSGRLLLVFFCSYASQFSSHPLFHTTGFGNKGIWRLATWSLSMKEKMLEKENPIQGLKSLHKRKRDN
ncbi:hypothetical protein QN277_007932 [Acacia crassicarpa]|uniref:Secreted protein n=1 Tax=Acacia crassicarpa TaxID=499986 RepID=A0AAE1ISM2_9FABA|nr:hypothetical protein QN277_007932 [Acacia crassicarpa]